MVKRTAGIMIAACFAALGAATGCSSSGKEVPAASSEGDAMNESSQADVQAETHAGVFAGLSMERLDGEPESLEAYQGQVVLVVNTASKCGFTRQYDGLQELYETYRDRGFVVLGFPANDFGAQEPGDAFEIAEFCRINYGVSFPMFAKTSVVGESSNPLYARFRELPEPLGGEPKWNFTKFLVGPDGQVVERFEPSDEPMSEEVTARVESLLGA